MRKNGQDEKIQLLMNYQIPDIHNLTEKYPILYQTEYLDKIKIKQINLSK